VACEGRRGFRRREVFCGRLKFSAGQETHKLKTWDIHRQVSVKKIRRSEEVTNARALEILRELATSTQLSEEQRKTQDYLEKVVKRDAADAEALVRQLMEKFGFTRVTAIQLVNLSLESLDELKTVLSYLERREYTDNELREILKLLTGQ
jgi:DNA-directed RNA polymerase subunit F